MTEKIKQIVDQFLEDRKEYQSSYKYRLNHSYYVKFQQTTSTDFVRVYLGVELPGYEYVTSDTYKFSPYRLSNDDEGLAALILMQYKETENKHKDSVTIGYNCYKSVLADNERLKDEINHLKKESQAWKDKYFKEKMDHTTTEARIVYAKHILNGNRDKDVVEHTEF